MMKLGKTEIKILKLLISDDNDHMNVSEISEKIGTSIYSTSQALSTLLEKKLVTYKTNSDKRIKIYKIITENLKEHLSDSDYIQIWNDINEVKL